MKQPPRSEANRKSLKDAVAVSEVKRTFLRDLTTVREINRKTHQGAMQIERIDGAFNK